MPFGRSEVFHLSDNRDAHLFNGQFAIDFTDDVLVLRVLFFSSGFSFLEFLEFWLVTVVAVVVDGNSNWIVHIRISISRLPKIGGESDISQNFFSVPSIGCWIVTLPESPYN